MEVQHVAQFSDRVELPRMTAAGKSERERDSLIPSALAWERENATPHRQLLMALVGLTALYVLQCVSPLRLESDAVDYLSTAAAIADGRALPNVSFPSGYPAIIAALDRLGMGSTSFFILTNCLFLAVGLWAVWRLFSEYSPRARLWIVIATLLVISVVKSVAAPLPEAAFFGTSLLSLAGASAALGAEGAKRWSLLALSFAVAAFAISIRVVGVALIPTLLWTCWRALSSASDIARRRQRRITAALVVGVIVAAVALALSKSSTVAHYLEHPAYWYVYGGLTSPVAGRVYGMLNGLGQMVVNLPLSRFHSLGPLFAAAGFVALVLLVIGRERPARLRLVDIYLGFYLAVLAVWPYDSPRLWMPIAPLIAAHVIAALDRARGKPAIRLFIPAYAVWFCLTGLAALAYTSRISLSGSNFSRVYGTDGGMATTALHTVSPKEIQRYNAQADTVINRYGAGRGRR
jgi:hypothetical protein